MQRPYVPVRDSLKARGQVSKTLIPTRVACSPATMPANMVAGSLNLKTHPSRIRKRSRLPVPGCILPIASLTSFNTVSDRLRVSLIDSRSSLGIYRDILFNIRLVSSRLLNAFSTSLVNSRRSVGAPLKSNQVRRRVKATWMMETASILRGVVGGLELFQLSGITLRAGREGLDGEDC